MTHLQILKHYFGYSSFREGQEPLIEGILGGGDALGIMPTGAGKSLCFQIPALVFGGLTLVVSPLISLMKDQVNALTQSGVPAAFINSSLTDSQVARALGKAAQGAYKLIYIAPERLLTFDFLHFAANADISMVTVDEAHCISQWGQDFRPSYTEIPKFIAHLAKRPVVSAFTATATARVKDDILEKLQLRNPKILVAGFDRPNLFFDVQSPADKLSALLGFLGDKKEKFGIVYCATRATVDSVCARLNKSGYTALPYHAGLGNAERRENQDAFLHDKTQIMVATNAFGMGIDKSNVSFVVHYNMPKDLEGYYQEAGRAGRDGEPADCLLLYSRGDVQTNMHLINHSSENENEDPEVALRLKKRNTERLQIMEKYCTAFECYRKFILSYFGETQVGEKCGNCANCETEFLQADITTEAQKIISCVARMNSRFGVNMVVDVLRGSKNTKVMNFRLDRLSTYGISKKSAAELVEIINFLLNEGYLFKTADKFPLLQLGGRYKEALSPTAQILMRRRVADEVVIAEESPVNPVMLSALKELRLQLARAQGVPAFVIFADSTLKDMCMKHPTTTEELLNVSGIGEVKAEKYGEQFLRLLAQFHATKDSAL